MSSIELCPILTAMCRDGNADKNAVVDRWKAMHCTGHLLWCAEFRWQVPCNFVLKMQQYIVVLSRETKNVAQRIEIEKWQVITFLWEKCGDSVAMCGNLCMYVRMYICNVCTYVRTYVCMYACMYVRTYVHAYVRTYACTYAVYVYIYVRVWFARIIHLLHKFA